MNPCHAPVFQSLADMSLSMSLPRSLTPPSFQSRADESLSGCAVFSALSACIIHLADILALVRTEILLEPDQRGSDLWRCHDADEMSGENPALEHH